MSHSLFNDLPDEILALIFDNSDPLTLQQLGLTDKRFGRIVKGMNASYMMKKRDDPFIKDMFEVLNDYNCVCFCAADDKEFSTNEELMNALKLKITAKNKSTIFGKYCSPFIFIPIFSFLALFFLLSPICCHKFSDEENMKRYTIPKYGEANADHDYTSFWRILSSFCSGCVFLSLSYICTGRPFYICAGAATLGIGLTMVCGLVEDLLEGRGIRHDPFLIFVMLSMMVVPIIIGLSFFHFLGWFCLQNIKPIPHILISLFLVFYAGMVFTFWTLLISDQLLAFVGFVAYLPLIFLLTRLVVRAWKGYRTTIKSLLLISVFVLVEVIAPLYTADMGTVFNALFAVGAVVPPLCSIPSHRFERLLMKNSSRGSGVGEAEFVSVNVIGQFFFSFFLD